MPVRRKVEYILKREFTEEQANILKALLFFLKRSSRLSLKNSTEEDGYRCFEIFYKEKNIGFIYYSKDYKEVQSTDAFKLNEDLIGKGLGILSYIKLAIIASYSGEKISSSIARSGYGRRIWKRLFEVGLAKKIKDIQDMYEFVDLSFLTKEDFKNIDKILNE